MLEKLAFLSKAGVEDDDLSGLPHMPLTEHLEELRSRILKALGGVGVAFAVSVIFTNEIWRIASHPVIAALTQLGLRPALVFTTPMEAFNTIWVKLPLLAAIFLASPWILYQFWAFIAPALYENERRLAAPFILSTVGLFVTGGLFSYFVAFRYGLTFLLGIGRDLSLQPMVTISEYLDLFVNVTLGLGVAFELPVLLFLLTLLHIVSPSFLLRNSRYAILGLTVIAAVISPTQDVVNLTLIVVPLCLLYFLGVLGSYTLILRREKRAFPWRKFLFWVAISVCVIACIAGLVLVQYGYHLVPHWPFAIRPAKV